MIFGIGTDILRIERGEKLWARHGLRAVDRILMPEEREHFERARNPGRYLARAFAAKEAFVKAFGTGFLTIGYTDVGAVRVPRNRPRLVYSAPLRLRMDALGIGAGHLSFSDEGGLIIAFVVLETC
jgi:holo-[acyl-carrier protein] synthase